MQNISHPWGDPIWSFPVPITPRPLMDGLRVDVAIVGAGLALFPERIGIPIFLMIEGALIVTLLILLIAAVYRKFATTRSDKSERSIS